MTRDEFNIINNWHGINLCYCGNCFNYIRSIQDGISTGVCSVMTANKIKYNSSPSLAVCDRWESELKEANKEIMNG